MGDSKTSSDPVHRVTIGVHSFTSIAAATWRSIIHNCVHTADTNNPVQSTYK